jgi:hypothetical protein
MRFRGSRLVQRFKVRFMEFKVRALDDNPADSEGGMVRRTEPELLNRTLEPLNPEPTLNP